MWNSVLDDSKYYEFVKNVTSEYSRLPKNWTSHNQDPKYAQYIRTQQMRDFISMTADLAVLTTAGPLLLRDHFPRSNPFHSADDVSDSDYLLVNCIFDQSECACV